MVEITILHWIYVIMVIIVLGTMITRRDTIIPCIIGVFLLGLAATGTISGGYQGGIRFLHRCRR